MPEHSAIIPILKLDFGLPRLYRYGFGDLADWGSKGMSFFRQFKNFDPVTGEVPDYPFSLMPVIAARSRRLLKGRTRDQIVSAAGTADWMIGEYFRDTKEEYIGEALRRQLHPVWNMLPKDQRTEASLRQLLDSPSHGDDGPPNLPTRENTSELEALKESIDWYLLDNDEDFPSARAFEFFAVFALWQLADAFTSLEYSLRKGTGFPDLDRIIESLPPEATKDDLLTNYSRSGKYALAAMDAVCWAEHLHADDARISELLRLRLELRVLSERSEQRAEAIAHERISLKASKAAIARHRENREMKADVFAWCAERLHEYSSMEKAAEAIAGQGRLVPVSVRTARDWIAEWRRQTRPARRP